jgi:hypothetical protein
VLVGEVLIPVVLDLAVLQLRAVILRAVGDAIGDENWSLNLAIRVESKCWVIIVHPMTE